MWALSEGDLFFVKFDKPFADSLNNHLAKITGEVKKIMLSEKVTKLLKGKQVQSWLPFESASDQASVLLLSLLNYYQATDDQSLIEYINLLLNGILQMQKGNDGEFPYYAFISWKNLWHAYGNLQSYALLNAYSVTKRKDVLTAALSEIKYFYKYLINQNYLSSFVIEKANGRYQPQRINQFPQIAYEIRPMVYACAEAFALTKDSLYATMAIRVTDWFFGNNIANVKMYYPQTGICFDGLESETRVNRNSGAESTIEALLSLMMLESNKISYNSLKIPKHWM